MDEDMMYFIRMADMGSLIRSCEAGELADKLEAFLEFYPERELKRKGRWIVARLRSISETSE